MSNVYRNPEVMQEIRVYATESHLDISNNLILKLNPRHEAPSKQASGSEANEVC